MSQVSRVELVVLSYPEQPSVLLLRDGRGGWHLPAVVCGMGAQTGKLAVRLLDQLLGEWSRRRLWLLGYWPPVAVYLALVDGVSVVGWWPVDAAIEVVQPREARLIGRAVQWLQQEWGIARRGMV